MKRWTTQQQLAARCRAIGMSQERTAVEVGRDLRTIQRWDAMTDFIALQAEYSARVVQIVEPTILSNLLLALDVERRVLNGELKPDDALYTGVARPRIERFLSRLLYVEPADTATGPTTNIVIGAQFDGSAAPAALAQAGSS